VIKKLKKWTVQMVSGANVATIVVMVLVGYSDRINPTAHPMLSTLGMVFPLLLGANLLFLVFWLLFKWTRAWIPIGGFLLAYVPISIYLPLHVHSDVPDGAVKLVSYNVCGYGGNYKYDDAPQRVYDYLTAEDADIVCMQEDNDPNNRRIFESFAKTLPYNDTIVLCHTKQSFNCLGIHTRYPIIRRERIAYPTTSNNGSAAWWLKVGTDTLIVVNNHFESCHLNKTDRQQYQQILKGKMAGDSARTESKLLLVKLAEANAKRAAQIDRVSQYVADHQGYHIVVCGDFNDNPLSYSRHAMAQQLTDCYVASGRGIGVSYNQKGFYFRIDHIFCSDSITPYNCKIDSRMDASDHYPIACWLKIGGKP